MSQDARRANSLDGKTWTRHSISVWSDIRKSKEELALKHPAVFPAELVERLIECFLPPKGRVVLDPFCGLGSTVVAAQKLGRSGIGLDINREYLELARARLKGEEDGCRLIQADARDVLSHVEPESVDLVVTSPPYWDVLTRRRTADRKEVRNYGDEATDLGRISDYAEFLAALREVFGRVFEALRPGAYCLVIVMDIRKKKEFHPFHADLAAEMEKVGYIWDDLIIWDRRHEYNNFRPLGYPWVFRINKAHEYVLILQKPKDQSTQEAIGKQLGALEEELLRPDIRRSADRTAALLADEFVEFGSSGRVYSKQDAIEGMAKEAPARWVVSDFKAVPLDRGVVLVTYRATRDGAGGGPPFESLRSSVWRAIGGRWQIVFHQGTPAQR